MTDRHYDLEPDEARLIATLAQADVRSVNRWCAGDRKLRRLTRQRIEHAARLVRTVMLDQAIRLTNGMEA